MNRAERRADRRQWSAGKKWEWLRGIAADPRLSFDDLVVAVWIAEHADENGEIVIPDDLTGLEAP